MVERKRSRPTDGTWLEMRRGLRAEQRGSVRPSAWLHVLGQCQSSTPPDKTALIWSTPFPTLYSLLFSNFPMYVSSCPLQGSTLWFLISHWAQSRELAGAWDTGSYAFKSTPSFFPKGIWGGLKTAWYNLIKTDENILLKGTQERKRKRSQGQGHAQKWSVLQNHWSAYKFSSGFSRGWSKESWSVMTFQVGKYERNNQKTRNPPTVQEKLSLRWVLRDNFLGINSYKWDF